MPDQVTHTLIVKGSPQELYDLWSDYERHPEFTESLKSVTKIDEKYTRWVMKGPLGKDLTWTTETTRDDSHRRIAWKTTEGDIKTSGQVTFTPLEQGETQVTLVVQYVPPAGKIGEAAVKILDEPEDRVEKDLYRFKEYVESRTARYATNKDLP
jgi:uncharacterized membrane protein